MGCYEYIGMVTVLCSLLGMQPVRTTGYTVRNTSGVPSESIISCMAATWLLEYLELVGNVKSTAQPSMLASYAAILYRLQSTVLCTRCQLFGALCCRRHC